MKTIQNKTWWLLLSMFILLSTTQTLLAQASGEIKWLRVNSLHAYFSEQGSEVEGGSGDEMSTIYFSWPGEYGIRQSTIRSRGMMIGCRDFYAAKVDKEFSYMVVNIGPKPTQFRQYAVFDAVEFKLIGRFEHPIVEVDGKLATHNLLYDELDELDETLIPDRMLIVKNHTLMGVTVTKKVYAFTQQNHNNYYIYDYVLKNTGIIDPDGTVYKQTLKDVYFFLTDRYSLAGESILGYDQSQRWAPWNASWGYNTVNDVIGTDPSAPEFNDSNSPLFQLRANIAWYGPHSEQPVEDDWGCPNYKDDGIMAAAKYIGHLTLHADKSVQDRSDDLSQPKTTHWVLTESPVTARASSQFDEYTMGQRYDAMRRGHAEKTHAELVGDGYANEYTASTGDIGGTTAVQGFGPYTLAPGDSIHIVTGQGVAGLSREKNREVGGNWIQWTNGTGNPPLIMPDGVTTTEYNRYKRAWVWTCKDSLLKTFRSALTNYESGFTIPQPPPPPASFTVKSGGDRIRLSWADNATNWPHFDGYVIYRSEGTVMDSKTVYKKIFECSAANVVHTYDDTSAVRGFDYYYYIQSKDDGSQNEADPGKPLVSSLFWTLTSVPAYLRRAAVVNDLEKIRVVPNPYDIRARSVQFGEDFQYDRIAFYGLPPECTIKIFTERGDVIWEKKHDDGSGDELWDSLTASGQIIVSGIYIAYFETPEGESVFRKFVVIR